MLRGRLAEALLARSLEADPGLVVTNGLFPSTRFHLESCGLEVLELPDPQARDPVSNFGFKGNLDLAALDALLAGPRGSTVRALYLELGVNAFGGHPVSLAHLRALRARLAGGAIPLALDATRAFANAALLEQREPGQGGRSLVAIVRDLCAGSDCCAASCMKDYGTPVGGFVATRSTAQATRLRDLALAYGDGLDGERRHVLTRALTRYPHWHQCGRERTRQVAQLGDGLRAAGVPVLAPAGGHAVFVDAAAMLPHLTAARHPAQALANALFERGGIRAAVNFLTPTQVREGAQLLRLAPPIGRCTDAQLADVVAAFKELAADPRSIRGLTVVHRPPGIIGDFTASYRPDAD